ncbi:BON domain-containing protein [bacterium]|nr:BON domain-containing protein [bacterium]
MEKVYLVSKVRTALATDERVGTTDLRVQFTPEGRGVVTGEVNSDAQRQAVSAVLAALPEARDFLNRTHVRIVRAPDEAEVILPGGHTP